MNATNVSTFSGQQMASGTAYRSGMLQCLSRLLRIATGQESRFCDNEQLGAAPYESTGKTCKFKHLNCDCFLTTDSRVNTASVWQTVGQLKQRLQRRLYIIISPGAPRNPLGAPGVRGHKFGDPCNSALRLAGEVVRSLIRAVVRHKFDIIG